MIYVFSNLLCQAKCLTRFFIYTNDLMLRIIQWWSTFFNSDNSNITYIKTQNHQIMATITYRILKFKSKIKKLAVRNHVFFISITLSKINSFCYINSIVIQHWKELIFISFKKSVIKTIYHVQFHKHNCLSMHAVLNILTFINK